MTDKEKIKKDKMLLKILKIKIDMIKIYQKIPAPFNEFVKPDTNLDKLFKYFERIK